MSRAEPDYGESMAGTPQLPAAGMGTPPPSCSLEIPQELADPTWACGAAPRARACLHCHLTLHRRGAQNFNVQRE